MEAHNYQVDGPCREVFLEVPFLGPKGEEPLWRSSSGDQVV